MAVAVSQYDSILPVEQPQASRARTGPSSAVAYVPIPEADMFSFADSCARAGATHVSNHVDIEQDDKDDENDDLDEEEDEDEDLDEEEDEDDDLDEEEDEDEDLDEQTDDETLTADAEREAIERWQDDADNQFWDWYDEEIRNAAALAAASPTQEEEEAEVVQGTVTPQASSSNIEGLQVHDPFVKYIPPQAVGLRSTLPPGFLVGLKPTKPGIWPFVMGWGEFMKERALETEDPYIDGKIPHPECTSSVRGINRCREDNLRAADRAIQAYLRAIGVANADSYTPFMDYRYNLPAVNMTRFQHTRMHAL